MRDEPLSCNSDGNGYKPEIPHPEVIWVSDDLLLTMAAACRGEGAI